MSCTDKVFHFFEREATGRWLEIRLWDIATAAGLSLTHSTSEVSYALRCLLQEGKLLKMPHAPTERCRAHYSYTATVAGRTEQQYQQQPVLEWPYPAAPAHQAWPHDPDWFLAAFYAIAASQPHGSPHAGPDQDLLLSVLDDRYGFQAEEFKALFCGNWRPWSKDEFAAQQSLLLMLFMLCGDDSARVTRLAQASPLFNIHRRVEASRA